MQPHFKSVAIRDVRFGDNVIVVEPVNFYDCEIGADSFIGPFVEIQRGVVIGKRCGIQSHVHICEMVTFGEACIVSHGAVFIYAGNPARLLRTLSVPGS